jgi:hypothetical protein
MSLPVFIPEMDTSTAGVNPWVRTVYSCQMSYQGAGAALVYSNVIPLLLSPESPDLQPLDTTMQPSNRYAWLSSYNSIAQMINQAVQDSLTSLGTKVPGLPQPKIRFYFDDDKQKFCIGLWPYNAFQTSSAVALDQFNFYFSENMRFMFSGFQLTNTLSPAGYFRLVTNSKPSNIVSPNYDSETETLQWSQNVQNFATANAPITFDPNPWVTDNFVILPPPDVQIVSGFIMTSNWSPLTFNVISSIIVTTTMNVLAEATVAPKNIQSQGSQQSYGSTILMDLTIDPTELGSTVSYVTYNSSTIDLSRRVKFTGSGPLYYFIVSLYWIDIYGNYRAIETNSLTQTCTMKLAFIPSQ